MNYNELGFRPFYKNFSILLNNDNIMDIVADLDMDEVFDGVLVYGYVDHEAGFTFEILSIAQQEDDGSMLREAIAAFNDDKTESHFIDVLELLKDRLVWL